jgi:hypothetical protein
MMWNDDPDSGKAWSSTHPTIEEAKTQAQRIEDKLAQIWTPGAIAGEIRIILTTIAANHGQTPPTDYDKALGHKEWMGKFRAAAKQAPGNVVDLVGAKNTVLAQWAQDVWDMMQEGKNSIITEDEAEHGIWATDILLDVLREQTT